MTTKYRVHEVAKDLGMTSKEILAILKNYLNEEKKYQSTIMRNIRNGGYKETFTEEMVNNFQVRSDNFLDSIIELDTKIAQTNNKNNKVVKIKEIA